MTFFFQTLKLNITLLASHHRVVLTPNALKETEPELVDVLIRMWAIRMRDVVLNALLTQTALLCWLAFRTNVEILVQAYVRQMESVKL